MCARCLLEKKVNDLSNKLMTFRVCYDIFEENEVIEYQPQELEVYKNELQEVEKLEKKWEQLKLF